MQRTDILTRWLAAATLTMATMVTWAAPVQVGQPLPALQIQDQHEQDWHVTPDTALILLAAGRNAYNVLLAVLGPQPKGF